METPQPKNLRDPENAPRLKPAFVAGHEGEARWWGGGLAVIKAGAADTGGQMTIVEVTEPPGAEAPLHVHHNEDEAFWVLDGDATFEIGETTVEVRTGDYAFGPRHIPHRYSVGDAGCRMLFILTPGGFEDLVTARSEPAGSRTLPPPTIEEPDMADVKAIAEAHGARYSMAEAGQRSTGSSAAQADLWSERARDWADVMEGWDGWGIPVYRHILERITVRSDTRVLDVGCGAGRFCRIAADRGARVSGLDATPALIDIARKRIPDGDFQVGDMEELPWPDDSFDVVTGFNSFFIATDMVNALAEARRVVRPGALVAMTVFGRPERCQSTAMFEAIGRLMPAKPAADGTEAGQALHEEGALEAVATHAGLNPEEAGYVEFVESYPNLETLLRGVMAAPPMVRAGRAVGDDALRGALTDAFQAFETATGSYALREEVRYLIARS